MDSLSNSDSQLPVQPIGISLPDAKAQPAPLPAGHQPPEPPLKRKSWRRLAGVSLIAISLIAGGILAATHTQTKKESSQLDAGQRFNQQSAPLNSLAGQLNSAAGQSQLTVNGQFNLNGTMVLQPSAAPSSPVAGQLYYDQQGNQLKFYNGTTFVSLEGGGNTFITNNGPTTNVTNGGGGGVAAVGGTPGHLAMFTAGDTLGDSLILQNGTNLTVGSNSGTSATVLQGGTGGLSLLTGDTSGPSGGIVLQSGASSTTAAGNITVDTGNNTINGLQVANYDFESGLTGGFNASGVGTLTVTQDCTVAHGGSCSMNLTGSDFSGGGNLVLSAQTTIDQFPVIPGHHYVLSMWVKAATTPAPIVGQIQNFTACGNPSNQLDNTSTWTNIVWNCTAPAGYTSWGFQVGFRSQLTETHYFDDITATDVSSSSTTASLSLGATNAQAVTIGNLNETQLTTIYGGSGINLNSGLSSLNATTGAFNLTSGSTGTITTNAGGLTVTSAGSSFWQITGSAAAGGNLSFAAGNGGGTGNGGNLELQPGLANGSGTAGQILLGADATPYALTVRGGAAAGNNVIGSNLTFDASNGTGVGGSGDFIFRTAGGVSNPLVTVDNVTGTEESSSNATLNWPHATTANTNRVMIVTVDTASPGTPSDATAVTYGGTPLTLLVNLNTSAHAHGSVWYLVNPPTGTATVSVTVAGNPSDVGANAVTFYNVDQTTPIANYTTNQAFGGSISTSLTPTNAGEGIFDALMTRATLGTPTPGAGQTYEYQTNFFGDTNVGSFRQGQAGSTTMSWTAAGNADLNHVVMALNPIPNSTLDTLTEAFRITQGQTLGVNLNTGENALSTITFGGSADRSIAVNQNPGSGSGHNLSLQAGGGAVGNNNGGNLVLQGGGATGSGASGAVSILTGSAANTSGSITIQTGNSTTTSAGNINVDTGSSIINGTTVANNTFETGTENYGFHNGGVAQSSAQAHSGTFSLAYTQGVGGTWDVEQQNTFSVTPGHTYHVSAWIRAGANPETVSTLMQWVGPGSNTALANVAESSSAWTQISGNVVAPAGATAAYLYFTGPWELAGFVHYFDDVTVIDMSSSPTQALVSVGATNAQALTLGNANEIGATNIYGGSGINVNSGVADLNISGGAIDVTGSGASTFQTSSGALNITAATTSTWQVGAAPSGNGGRLTILAGNGAAGNNNGGDLQLQGGQGTGAGSDGAILLGQDGTPRNLTVRGGVASGINAGGGTITFDASNGTGAAGSGAFIFRTAKPGSTAVQVDATNQSTGTGCTTFNQSFTTGSGSNRLLLVEAETAIGETFTSITYNGVAMTQLATKDSPTVHAATAAHIELWYLLNPPTGTHTIAATLSNNIFACLIGSASFFNVDQTTPFGTVSTANGTTSGLQATHNQVASTGSSQVVVDAIGADTTNNLSNGPGQTQLWYEPATPSVYGAGGAYAPGTGGNVDMSWSIDSADWADIGVPLNAVADSTADTLADVFHITGAGNVGVGNSSPQYTLDVGGTSRVRSIVNSATAFQVQDQTGTALLTADTTAMTVTVKALIVTADLTVDGHIITGGSTPGIAAGAAANCSGAATVNVTGNDTSGTVTITTGAGPCASSGDLADLTFANAFGAMPNVILTPAEPNASTLQYYSTPLTTGFSIGTNSNNVAAATTYKYSYLVTQ